VDAERLYGWASSEVIGSDALRFSAAKGWPWRRARQRVMEKGEWMETDPGHQGWPAGFDRKPLDRWCATMTEPIHPQHQHGITQRRQIEAQSASQRMESIAPWRKALPTISTITRSHHDGLADCCDERASTRTTKLLDTIESSAAARGGQSSNRFFPLRGA